MTSNHEVNTLIAEQLGEWAQACDNYAALADVKVKEFDVDGMHFKVQFNPARAVSSGAKVDAASIKARKCFLCAENRPEVQRGISWENEFTILVNPFPIFPRHLTIPDNKHVPQVVEGSVSDMLQLASELSDYTVFYNGARCGALSTRPLSLPSRQQRFSALGRQPRRHRNERSHLAPRQHAVSCRRPTDKDVRNRRRHTPVGQPALYRANPRHAKGRRRHGTHAQPPCLCHANRDKAGSSTAQKHRPSFYGTEGYDCMLLSPAAVDMGGVFITPGLWTSSALTKKQYAKLSANSA